MTSFAAIRYALLTPSGSHAAGRILNKKTPMGNRALGKSRILGQIRQQSRINSYNVKKNSQ